MTPIHRLVIVAGAATCVLVAIGFSVVVGQSSSCIQVCHNYQCTIDDYGQCEKYEPFEGMEFNCCLDCTFGTLLGAPAATKDVFECEDCNQLCSLGWGWPEICANAPGGKIEADQPEGCEQTDDDVVLHFCDTQPPPSEIGGGPQMP